MPRVRDRTIGFTISIAFAATLFLMVVLVALTLNEIEGAKHNRQILIDDLIPAIDKTEDVESGIARFGNLVRLGIQPGLPDDLQVLAMTDRRLGGDIDLLSRWAHPDSEQAVVDALRKEVAQIRAAARDALDRKPIFGLAIAFHQYWGNVDPLLKPAIHHAQTLESLKRTRLEKIRASLTGRGDRLTVYLVVGFLAACVVCILIARSTIRMITVPARRLVMAARVLERGEYDRAIDLGAVETAESVQSVNEIDLLRQTFVRMARGLQEREDRLLQQSRHLEATNNRLAALQSITDVALTHLAIADLLPALVERVVAATGARGAAVLLADETGRLRACASHAIAPDAVEAFYNHRRGGWGPWMSDGSEPLSLSMPADEARLRPSVPEDPRIGAMVALPLMAGGRVVGLAHVESARPSEFADETVALMRVFAERVALAIERAQAFAALEEWNQTLARRVAEQQEQLVRTERLASIGLIGAGIAHELRNPLGVITNSVFYLRQRLRGADEKIARHAEIIEREVAHAVRIIDSLVQFSHETAPSAYPVDLRRVFETTLQRVGLPDSVALQVDLPDALPLVQADEQRLTQVLENLLRNAAQAMEGHGTVTLAAEASDGVVTFSIQDTGPGIAPADRDRIFEPLFSTKAKGMGLGLALCKKMVEAWGGSIRLECPPQGGTAFTIQLPVAQALPTLPAGLSQA